MTASWLDVSDVNPVISYTVGGPQSVFAVPFIFFADTDLDVSVNGVQKTITTDYTVTGAANPAGGSITFVTPQTNVTVLIARDVPIRLDTHIPPSGPLDVPGLNIQFSKIVAMVQQHRDALARSVRVPIGESILDAPALLERAGLIASYDGLGNPTAVSTTFLSLGIGQRGQVRAATTANVNLANALENGDTIDGIVLATGDLVLVKNQTTATENGVYTVPAAGAASRATAFDTYAEILNSLIMVAAGTTNAFTLWINTNNTGGTLGATAINFARKSIETVIFAEPAPSTVSPRTFGAVGDGVTDDTVALQNAINECQTTGKTLDLGPGRYRITAQLDVTAAINIIGAGWDNTSIELGSQTISGIAINANNGMTLRDFQIVGANNGVVSQATAGSLISITGPSVNSLSVLRDLRLIFGFNSIAFTSAQHWTIDSCFVLGNPLTGTGIIVQNAAFPGNGELQISDTLIQGGDALSTWGGSGIFHASGVNLKIINSEIFGWVNGYNLTLNSATAMAGTFIANCVFSQVENAITLNKGTGTSYSIVNIKNNEIIARNPIASDANIGWLSDLIVTGNFIAPGQGQPVSAATGTGVNFPAAQSFIVNGNIFSAGAGNNSIIIGANATNGAIFGNKLIGALNGISNSSPTTTVIDFTSSGWSFTGGSASFGGSVKSSSPTAGVGYATGAGGTVTQATNKSTAVTLNTATGQITMNGAALAAATIVSFTLNDTAIAATDLIAAMHESGGTTGAYTINARATGAGTAAIDVRNNTAGSLSEAIVIRFAVIKGVNT